MESKKTREEEVQNLIRNSKQTFFCMVKDKLVGTGCVVCHDRYHTHPEEFKSVTIKNRFLLTVVQVINPGCSDQGRWRRTGIY
jgi:hypothetical protein